MRVQFCFLLRAKKLNKPARRNQKIGWMEVAGPSNGESARVMAESRASDRGGRDELKGHGPEFKAPSPSEARDDNAEEEADVGEASPGRESHPTLFQRGAILLFMIVPWVCIVASFRLIRSSGIPLLLFLACTLQRRGCVAPLIFVESTFDGQCLTFVSLWPRRLDLHVWFPAFP